MDELIKKLEVLECRARLGVLDLVGVRYVLRELVDLVEKMARKIKEMEGWR